MKPRRILHILRSADGGVPVVVRQLCSSYDKMRYKPLIIFDTDGQSYIRKELSESYFKTIDFKKASNEKADDLSNSAKSRDIGGWFETHFGRKAAETYFSLRAIYTFLRHEAPRISLFLKAIRENEIDLIHTHSNLRECKSEIIAAKIAGIPCVSHSHGYPSLTHFDRIFSRLVDMIIYISADVAEYQIAQGVPHSKGVIIHNGVEMSEFARQYDPAQVRREFNIKPDEILIGIIGRVDWWKGHEYFLRAIAEVAENISGIKGIVVGGFEKDFNINRNRQYFCELKSLITSLSLDDKIIFAGQRHDVPRLISALDIVVHASSTPEPFGLVVIEAMAAGKPVIATAAGGILEIIEDEVNGLLIPCKNSQAMAQSILRIIHDWEKAEQMALAARRDVAEKFTLQHQVTAVQDLYDIILGIGHRR